MTGPVQIEVKSEATSAALRQLASQIRDRRQVNRQLAVQMSSWVARNFAAEGALGGEHWASLKPSTANRRITKRGDRRGYEHILVASGLMRASFAKFGYDNDSATIGSDVRYAEYHETGTATMPRRPMLPSKEIALELGTQVYDLYIKRAQKGAGL